VTEKEQKLREKQAVKPKSNFYQKL